MDTNLHIKETSVDTDLNVMFGEGEFYETFAGNVGELFKEMQKEHGRCISKMYIDDIHGSAKQIGWVFSKIEKYSDTKEFYHRETWVEVSSTAPRRETTVKNITYPFQ